MALATLATMDPAVFSNYHKSLVKRIRIAVRSSDIIEAKSCYKFLFDLVYTLAKTVDEQCTHLTDNPDYQRHITDIIALKMDKGTRALLTFRARSEEHTSELQSLMRISYAAFCSKNKIYNSSLTDNLTLL